MTRPCVVFFCERFHQVAGGVERISIALMNDLVERGWRVCLVTCDNQEATPFFPLSSKITWTKMGQNSSWWDRVCDGRRVIQRWQPQVMVGFQLGQFLYAYACSWLRGIPVISAERNSIDQYRIMGEGRGPYWKTVAALGLASRISVQDPSYVDLYPSWLRGRIAVTPNPVWPVDGKGKAGKKVVLNVGRLSPQKHQGFLIRSFGKVASSFPDWTLRILGSGELIGELEALIVETGLVGRVQMAGTSDCMADAYRESSIFAFPSLFEGFPNAVGEAMAHGLPVIGLEETHGVNSLVAHGVTGLLTKSHEEDFAVALRELMGSAELRNEFGMKGRKVIGQYNPEEMLARWETFLQETAASQGARASPKSSGL